MENSIQYLREIALVEVVYGINLVDNTNSQNADDIKRM